MSWCWLKVKIGRFTVAFICTYLTVYESWHWSQSPLWHAWSNRQISGGGRSILMGAYESWHWLQSPLWHAWSNRQKFGGGRSILMGAYKSWHWSQSPLWHAQSNRQISGGGRSILMGAWHIRWVIVSNISLASVWGLLIVESDVFHQVGTNINYLKSCDLWKCIRFVVWYY